MRASGGRPVLARPGPRAFLVAFALVYAAMAAWSLAMPLYSAPDEPTHVMRAAAVDRGELLGALVDGPSSPFAEVHLPEYYANVRYSPVCYHTHPGVPASCAAPVPIVCPRHPITGHPACTIGFIYNARYPPLYYWVVGLPSLLGVGNWAVYLMRLLSAALCALFVALAAFAVVVWSRTRVLLLGIAVAATPMVVYLGGVVNPSGLEIAAALCFWTTGLLIVREHLSDPPPGLVLACAGSAATFVVMRGLSPFWLALCTAALVAVHERGALRAFLRHRRVQVAGLVLLVFGLVAVVWILKEHSLLQFSTMRVPRSTPRLTVLETSFARNDFYIPDMVGVFGDFDAWAPTLTYVAWYGLVGFLVIAAAARVRRSHRLVLVAMTVAIVCVPVAISSSQAYREGYVWQGRDTLPFAVGLPLLAAGLLGLRALARRRLSTTLGAIAFVAQFGAFYEALRRYAVGTRGPDFGFLLHSPWHGPLPNLAIVLVELVVLLGAYAGLALALRDAPGDASGGPAGEAAAMAADPVVGTGAGLA